MSNDTENAGTTISPEPVMLKVGVDLKGIQPQMAIALTVAIVVYKEWGFPCVVTSGGDGKHMRSSKHYTGCALDLRSPSYYSHANGDPALDHRIGQHLRQALGPQFDVVVEGYSARPDGTVPPRHIHVEFDPKEDIA